MSRWSAHSHGPQQGSASAARSPVLPQCDVISEGEELTRSDGGGEDVPVRFLRLQRRLLTVSRDFVEHRMRVLEYYKMVARTPLSGLEATCLRLQDLCHGGAMLQRRVRANQLLRPLCPPILRTLRSMRRTLQLMSVQAAIVTRELVLRAVRCAARAPEEVPGGLSHALTLYNKVIAEVLPWAPPGADMLPLTVARCLEMVAEERAWLLLWGFSRAGLRLHMEDLLKGEAESPEMGGALLSHLETIIREDRGQVAPLLELLAPPDHLYENYCSHLWPLLCAHLFQALYPGRRGPQALPTLAPCAERARSLTPLLRHLLISAAVPEPCRERSRVLSRQLLCTVAAISWDRGMCQALGSALTDKCLPDDGGGRTHSRTCAALVTVCQEVLVLLRALRSGNVSGHHGTLSRGVTSLQLCDRWLRVRSQIYTSSGSVRHLLLISHGDVPMIKEQMRRMMATTVSNVEWSPACQRLYGKLVTVAESLEAVSLSLPRRLGSVCARQAEEVFQHMMPVGRHWRGKVAGAPDLVPSEYAEAAISTVLVPVLQGVHTLAAEEQKSAVSGAVGAFMEAWLGHILQERLRFSLQGALQLRCDFERVRELLKSPQSALSPEVVQAALSLPVFQQADNAIVCLLQQPSRKAYLQSHGCSVFCCPPLCGTAVESVSDSLQSLDSLGRRVWSHNYPAHRPRHSHDSYLPHNQRQWLSLRLHKSWTGLG